LSTSLRTMSPTRMKTTLSSARKMRSGLQSTIFIQAPASARLGTDRLLWDEETPVLFKGEPGYMAGRSECNRASRLFTEICCSPAC